MDDQMDRRLARIVSDAVADLEPTDRLVEIRERTSQRRDRRGWYAAGGAVLAAAAAVTAVALAGGQDRPRADEPGPVATQPPSSPAPTAASSAYPVYYLGETPAGTRLYREFRRAEGKGSLPTAIRLLESAPGDPDYRTPWPAGSFETAELSQDTQVIEVQLADASLHDLPDGMDEAEAELAIQQVVYTLQAVAGDRHPVQFRLGGNPIDQVLGVPTSEPLANAGALEVLALVNISDPSEGSEVEDLFVASGVSNSYEATVPWQILREGEVLLEGFATAEGWMGERLFPWEAQIDVSSLDPGTYTFRAMTSDPSNGEGPGAFEDTRTIVVQ